MTYIENIKYLKSLNIGDIVNPGSETSHQYLRVPGGWIVTLFYLNENGFPYGNSVFVPETDNGGKSLTP